MYASRSETLIRTWKYLFFYTLLPVAIYKLLQICENENSSLESKSLLQIYGCGTWFILICNLLSYYLQFHKKNVTLVTLESRSTYQRCLQLIYICLTEMCKAQIISLILLTYIILVLSFCRYINVIKGTLNTGLLQTTDKRKLRKAWVTKAPGHVSD